MKRFIQSEMFKVVLVAVSLFAIMLIGVPVSLHMMQTDLLGAVTEFIMQ